VSARATTRAATRGIARALVLALAPALLGAQATRDTARTAGAADSAARTDSATAARRLAAALTDTSTRRWRALPVVGSAPETGVQLGGMLIRVTRPAGARATSRPTTDRLLARVTTRSQLSVEFERDAWFADDAWRLNTSAEYSRFPLAFYGFGADSPEAAEELYTPRTLTGTLLVQRRLVRGLYAGAGYTLARTWMRGLDADGVLVDGTIPGSRGGTVATLDLSLVADTRDNVYAPRRGHLVTAQLSPSRSWLGSGFDFTRTLLDARLYRPLGARTSVALQGVVDDMNGTPPFDRFPTIGTASIMRAYDRGRYRGPTLAAAQVELRRDLPRRLALAVWGGVGTVAADLSSLGDARIRPSMGVGGRWFLFPAERLAVRADLAFGRGATGIYLGIGEAF
jgi:outer membrane protein assembly factor BamA